MERITNWSAKRAGGRITISGYSSGAVRKLVGVDTIRATLEGIIATDKAGVQYALGTPT